MAGTAGHRKIKRGFKCKCNARLAGEGNSGRRGLCGQVLASWHRPLQLSHKLHGRNMGKILEMERERVAMPLAFVSRRVGLVGPTAQLTAADNPPATATPTAAAD